MRKASANPRRAASKQNGSLLQLGENLQLTTLPQEKKKRVKNMSNVLLFFFFFFKGDRWTGFCLACLGVQGVTVCPGPHHYTCVCIWTLPLHRQLQLGPAAKCAKIISSSHPHPHTWCPAALDMGSQHIPVCLPPKIKAFLC